MLALTRSVVCVWLATLVLGTAGCGGDESGAEGGDDATLKNVVVAFVDAVNDGRCESDEVSVALGTDYCQSLVDQGFHADLDQDALRVLEADGSHATLKASLKWRKTADDGFTEGNIDPVFDLVTDDEDVWHVLDVSEGYGLPS